MQKKTNERWNKRRRRRSTIKLQYFKAHEKFSCPFFSIPLFLWMDAFQGLHIEAKMLYGMLWSRTELSRKNGWHIDGNVYVVFTIKTVMEKLHCCEQKAVGLMKALKTYGLIERQRNQNNQAYRIFLKQPVEIMGQAVKNDVCDNEKQGSAAMKITRYIDRKEIDRKNQIDIDKKNIYGSNQNVFLSDTEYETLKKEFPRDYQRRIDRLSHYMLAKNRSYSDHMATIRLWADKEKETTNNAKKPDYSHSKGVSL